jgi:hypothetical protein
MMASKSFLRMGVWFGCFVGVFLGVSLVWGQTITVLSYPTNPVPGGSTVTITWRIDGAVGAVTHNHVHWGGSLDMVDRQYSTPHARSTPYTAVFPAPITGESIYFRVHAIVNGRDIYSDIFAIAVLPPQSGSGTRRVKTPVFIPGSQTFLTTIEVTITCGTPEAIIRYTLDGTDPTESSPMYTTPILIRNTTTIKARAYKSGLAPSAIATATYTYNPDDTYEQDDNIEQVNRFQGNRQFPKWLTHLDEKNPPVAADAKYKSQARSIYPAGDPDYVKFTLSRPSVFVAALWPPLNGTLPQFEAKDLQLRRHPDSVVPIQINQIGRGRDIDIIVAYSPIRAFPPPNSPGESGYYFIINHSDRVNEYILGMGALPQNDDDIYESVEGTGSSPPQRGEFKIGEGNNLVHIRKITRTDVDWAWFQVPTRSRVGILCAGLPGTGRISVATYGPNNITGTISELSFSVPLSSDAISSSSRTTTLPGSAPGEKPPVYYVKITADTTAIYVLKVEVDPQ